MASNILSSSENLPDWNPAEPLKSLQTLYTYSEAQAKRAIDWYYDRKGKKAALSRWSRFLTILLTGLGGLFPILSTLLYPEPQGATGESTALLDRLLLNQWGYFALGLAGLSLAFDRFYGGSSGWMRYIITASALETLVEEFRFDWVKLQDSLVGTPPPPDRVTAALDRLKIFSLAVRSEVERETHAWMTEFQSSLAQLEQETKKGLEYTREQARKDQDAHDAKIRAAADAQRPGAIDLTVKAPPLDSGYTVELDGRVRQSGITGATCGLTGVAPGLHEIGVTASAGGKKLLASKAITVVGGSTSAVSIELT